MLLSIVIVTLPVAAAVKFCAVVPSFIAQYDYYNMIYILH